MGSYYPIRLAGAHTVRGAAGHVTARVGCNHPVSSTCWGLLKEFALVLGWLRWQRYKTGGGKGSKYGREPDERRTRY